MPKKLREVRRPEIVEAYYQAIKTSGVSLPTNDQISQQAGMSRQLVRHYFPDTEELMLALCDWLAASYKQALMKGIIAADTSRRLNLFLDFYFDFLAEKGLEKPKDDSVYDALFAAAGTNEAVRKNLREQYTLLQFTVAHEVQISHPELPQSACEELAFLVVSLMYGHWKMVASLGFSTTYNRVSRQAIDRLIASYLDRYDDPDAAAFSEADISNGN